MTISTDVVTISAALRAVIRGNQPVATRDNGIGTQVADQVLIVHGVHLRGMCSQGNVRGGDRSIGVRTQRIALEVTHAYRCYFEFTPFFTRHLE